MQTLNTILNIVLIVLSIAMIAVVLMQQSKSAGLGSAFGGDTQSFTARGQKGGQASAHHQDTCSCNRRDRYCHGYNKLIKGKNVTLGRAAKVCPCFYAIKKEKMKNENCSISVCRNRRYGGEF